MALGRSFGVCGASPLTFDKIDFRISLLCVFGRIADDPLSNDDFLNNVFGVAGVSNSLNARTFRYGGDSKCIFDCINVLCRSGRIIWLSKIGNNWNNVTQNIIGPKMAIFLLFFIYTYVRRHHHPLTIYHHHRCYCCFWQMRQVFDAES